jgi:hypothetical protein
MRQKVVSVLPIVKSKTQREQSPWKTKVALLYLWPHLWLEESFKQVFQTTHLVYPMDC